MDKVTEIDVQPMLEASSNTLKVIIKSTTVLYIDGKKASVPKEVSYDLMGVPKELAELVTDALIKINNVWCCKKY